eukprot:295335_1
MASPWTCDVCNGPNGPQDVACQTCFCNPDDLQSNGTATPSPSFEAVIEHQIGIRSLLQQNDETRGANPLQLSDLSLSELLMPSLDLFPPPFNPKSAIDPAIIPKLQNKQHLLFHGYLRSLNIADISDEASHNNHLMYIPSDIITLCYTFFNLHIETLCTAINKSHPAVYAVNYQINHQLTMEEIRDIRQGIKQRFRPDMKQEHLITYDDLYELAMILRGQKDCFIAYELMQCLVEQKADSSEYHNGMGLILKRWNCLEDAEKHYKLAIDGELTENIYKWNYGLLLEEGQKFELALQQFLGASKNVDEKEPDYIFEAAYCYQKLGDYDNATVSYLRAIEMNGEKSSYWIYYAEYLCEELKEYKESIKCFEKAIALENQSNANYLYRFARYLRDFHKNYALSEVYYKKCLALNEERKAKPKGKNGIKGVNGSYGYLLFLMKQYET